jgi:hypothetical protein
VGVAGAHFGRSDRGESRRRVSADLIDCHW